MVTDVTPEDKAAIEREFFNRLTDAIEMRAKVNEDAGKDPITAWADAACSEFIKASKALNAPTTRRARA